MLFALNTNTKHCRTETRFLTHIRVSNIDNICSYMCRRANYRKHSNTRIPQNDSVTEERREMHGSCSSHRGFRTCKSATYMSALSTHRRGFHKFLFSITEDRRLSSQKENNKRLNQFNVVLSASSFSKLAVISQLKEHIESLAVAVPVRSEDVLVKCAINTQSWNTNIKK